MANRKASIWLYVKTPAGWRYCKPVIGKNNKSKPGWAHVNSHEEHQLLIRVRRSVWKGKEQAPKTVNAMRETDIDTSLAALLKEHIGERKAGRLFEAKNGSPISDGNVRKRVLHPLLKKLEIPKAGLHAFRHSRVTMLRKNGTPEDLQKLWIGHSSLRTTDRYSHTHEELEYRRRGASKVGLNLIVGPNGPKMGGMRGAIKKPRKQRSLKGLRLVAGVDFEPPTFGL